MAEFWLISVPLDKTSLTGVEKLKRTAAKTSLASCCKFFIPDLKVSLCIIFPTEVRVNVIKKTCQCMKEVMEPSSDKVLESASANEEDLVSYMTKFQWDKAKYPTALPLSSLAGSINKEVSQVETELKSRAAAYSSVKANLQSLKRKLDGSLQTRSLNDFVKREDLVVSEYLTTLLVVVTRGSYSQWENTYESLTEFVVPRSSRKLYEDREGGVFSVTLFKRAVCEFKAKAKRKVDLFCMPPPPTFPLQGVFARWLKVNLSEVFIAWIHVKVLRVFVESVLRYGLPVGYQVLLLQTDKKHSKRLREELASLFIHLDPTASMKDVSCDIPGLSQQEYFSYVCFHISTSMLEIS
uniref:V-type proton ATPase subunit C n=1 Tax=Salarias fasciatus TaxID=181472 RepID=A0A672HSS2_SALFA